MRNASSRLDKDQVSTGGNFNIIDSVIKHKILYIEKMCSGDMYLASTTALAKVVVITGYL